MNQYLKALLIIHFSLLIINYSSAQELRKINNNAFRRGEYLKYEAYYHSFITGRVSAGIVTLEVKKENTQFYGRNTLHIEGIGKTRGVFNLFYKVIDRYETFIDEDAIAPWKFIRRVNEGDYKIEQDIYFNQFDKKATIYNLKKNSSDKNQQSAKITQYTQDIISAFYYARTFDITNLKLNQEFPLNFLLDDSVYVTKIIYVGKQNITTSMGEFRCLKFKPMVLKGNVFSDPYPMTLYISDDQNRIPILVESAVIVGTVKLELISFSNLANPFSSIIIK